MAQHPDILRLVSSSRMIVLLVHRPLYVLMFTFLSSKILPYTIRFDAFHNGIRQIEVHTVPFEIRIVCFGLKAAGRTAEQGRPGHNDSGDLYKKSGR